MSLEASAVWDILPLQKLSVGNAQFKCLLAEHKKKKKKGNSAAMCALFFFLADTDIKFLQSPAQTPTELEMREKGRVLHFFFLLSHLSEEVYKLLKELTSSKCRTRFRSYMAIC